jgi:hypothetical protein
LRQPRMHISILLSWLSLLTHLGISGFHFHLVFCLGSAPWPTPTLKKALKMFLYMSMRRMVLDSQPDVLKSRRQWRDSRTVKWNVLPGHPRPRLFGGSHRHSGHSETEYNTLFSRTQKGVNNNGCHSHNQSKHQECTSLITPCLLVFSIHANAPTYGVARSGHLCRTMSKSKWARGNQTKKRRHTWGTEYIP